MARATRVQIHEIGPEPQEGADRGYDKKEEEHVVTGRCRLVPIEPMAR
jgi:hypothetical protein